MSDLSRRQFLKRSAIAAAGASLTGNGALARVYSSPSPQKILILGAGISGLVAGYELTQLGHDATILEARLRPGGRVQTLREPFSDGLFAEAGAARIPDDHNLTLKYVKLFNLPLEPMYPNKLSALRLDNGPRRQVAIDGFTVGLGETFGSELGGAPSRWSKIKGGSDLLPGAFAQALAGKIHYGAPVVRIEQTANQVTAVVLHAGAQERLTADRMLCTIPFSVLRNIELPAGFSERRLDLIKKLDYASVSRVFLQSRSRFWEAKGLNGFALTSNQVEIWQPTWSQPGLRGILMTYARPGVAEGIAKMKEPERISTTLTRLDAIYPGLKENFERGASKCWSEDEWARGAWAFVGLRDLMMATRPEGRIYFAGEHLSTMASWMQGALDSGLRAVKEINEAI